MLAVYLLSAILGVGLIVFSSFGGGETDTDLDIEGDAWHGGAGQILLGLFSTRNLTYFVAAFGAAGLILTFLDVAAVTTALVAGSLGVVSMGLSHTVFTWLKRTDSALNVFGDADFSGMLARVVLPVSATERGQIACNVAGREMYLTARLDANGPATLQVGDEVIILHADDGVATIIAASQIDQLPST
jgi:hypothetical protein